MFSTMFKKYEKDLVLAYFLELKEQMVTDLEIDAPVTTPAFKG